VAFAEALRERGALALVATHFDGVAQASAVPHVRIAGLREDALATVQADDLDAALDAIQAAMDYRIVAGRDGEAVSDALALARLLGLDAHVVDRAVALNDESPANPSGS
jgi:DNA mismatch repair ATPase MutS